MTQPSSLDRQIYEDLRQRLVDRTRRNRALHFDHPARTAFLRFVATIPEDVIELLQGDSELGFKPLPDPIQVGDETKRPDAIAHARQVGIIPEYELGYLGAGTASRQDDGKLQTLLFSDELQARLASLKKKSREIQAETGVNTLHLAYGFLEWFESDSSDIKYSSPLLLLPVDLRDHKVRGKQDEWRMAALETVPPTANLGLELRLREDFQFSLPSFNTASVEAYLAAVEEATNPFKRWRLRRYLTLAPFSSTRIAMYHDLDPARWASQPEGEPFARPLIRSFLRSGAQGLAPPSDLEPDTNQVDIDDPVVAALAPVLVHDADSSQHSAIIDAMGGRSLVIEGPPGTGKSQTIANLIANMLYNGKNVLFVSEKMAALDVVKKRLDGVGLGHFCVPIHAAGAKPEAVVKALQARYGLTALPLPRPSPDAMQAARAREQLKAHLRAIHAPVGPDDETVHALIGRLAELARVLPYLPRLLRHQAQDLPPILDAAAVAGARELLEALEAAAMSPERPDWDPRLSPFSCLERADLFPGEREDLLLALAILVADCAKVQEAVACLPAWLGHLDRRQSIMSLGETVSKIAGIPDPAPGSDRGLLVRLTTPEAIDIARRAAKAEVRRGAAVRILIDMGVAQPASLRVDVLDAAIQTIRSLGLGASSQGELPELRQLEAAWPSYDKTVTALRSLLGLDPDPEAASLCLACEAAALAAGADDAVYAHRRDQLHLHVSRLQALASQQDMVHRRIAAVATEVRIDGLSASALREAAAALRGAGMFAVFQADVRAARRFVRSCWLGRRRVRPAQVCRALERAADALAAQEDLYRDPVFMTVLSYTAEDTKPPLGRIARTARWQAEVEESITSPRVEAAALRRFLIVCLPDQLRRLSALAKPGEVLAAYLQRAGAAASQSWSETCERAAQRAQLIEALSNALRLLGLPTKMGLSDLSDVAIHHRQYLESESTLAAPATMAILRGQPLSAGAILAAADFAQRIIEVHPEAATGLLGDGWTDAITALRQAARTALAALSSLKETLQKLGNLGFAGIVMQLEQQPIEAVAEWANGLIRARDELAAYLRFARPREDCMADPLARSIVQALDRARLPLRHMPEALEWLLAHRAVRRAAEADRAVFSQSGHTLSTSRDRFAQADRDQLAHDARLVAATLLKRHIPRGSAEGGKKTWTGAAMIANEFMKKKGFAPVRDVLGRGSDAVLALTPCLMMSPLTVAQYLRPGHIAFDVVIMDEASQIRPEDALGAVLRGRQVVIVGDRHQLPPSSFFDRAFGDGDGWDEEETDETEGDRPLAAANRVNAESVLAMASGALRPSRQLRWHYRSQHESLIAFSNKHFYDSKLVIFPAAQEPSETLGIELVRLDGVWRDKRNVEEARAVARAVVDFEQRHPSLSYGVVTMNQPQKELVQEEIDRLAGEAAAGYREFWEGALEPPFVKNLENVQGDERDVIFISLGWARSAETGRLPQLFPLNRKGGERRLNVLMTRAKRKIVLFSSFQPAEIAVDPGKTAQGVCILRDYLVYARDGQLPRAPEGEGEADSPFETSVANALRARGHDIALQVGVAGYRVDLGVRHPTEPWRFVLGIECDGATYHRARSARDRDRLRQEALERLGWRLLRVWSTDWFRDPESEAKRLSAAIEKLIAEDAKLIGRRARLVEVAEASETLRPVGCSPIEPQAADAAWLGAATQPAETVAEPLAAPRDVASVLRGFRDTIIMVELPGSEPDRCILRDEMIRAIVESGLDDINDFHGKIPGWLRARTDGRQTRYLERICDLVADNSRP